LFGLSGLYHGLSGICRALSIFRVSIPSFLKPSSNVNGFWGIVGIGSAALVSGLLALGGFYYSPGFSLLFFSFPFYLWFRCFKY